MLWTLGKLGSCQQNLEVVAKAGYGGVELVGEFQHWSPDESRHTLSRLDALGLVVDAASGLKAGFAVPDQSEAFLADFRQHLTFLNQLRCRQAILLSGPVVPGTDAHTQQQTAIENLTRAAELAAAAEVEIVIEPIDPLENPTTFLQSVLQAFPIVRAVNRPNVKVLYDLYHEQRSFGNLMEKLQNNLNLIGLIHVADVPGRHEPGTGEIDFPVIYRKLAELHYSRWIAMEFLPTGDPVKSLNAARLSVDAAFRS